MEMTFTLFKPKILFVPLYFFPHTPKITKINIRFLGRETSLILSFLGSKTSSYVKFVCFFFPPFYQFLKNGKEKKNFQTLITQKVRQNK
jgi:hypothetical protein